jgi:long-subunit acyl-CoA synthetase (AMP-forming)
LTANIETSLFLRLMARIANTSGRVVARNYANGVWQQYSGSDFVAHLGRSARGWKREEATIRMHSKEKNAQRPVLMCVGVSSFTSYAEWIAGYGALLQGFDVFFAPEQLSGRELKLCLRYFGIAAIICDPNLFAERYKNLGVPIYQTEHRTWAPGDRQGFPEIVDQFRNGGATTESAETARLPGDLLFISIGNDGYHKKVRLSLNAFMVTAQNLLLHLDAPSWFEWRSIEMVSLSHPFAHTARLALLLKNGVVGFMNPASDWQANLEVLRPTCLFVGPPELQQIASHVSVIRRKSRFSSRVAMSEGLGAVRKYLEGGRSFRLSPGVHAAMSGSIRKASQIIVGSDFMSEALGDLKFVVHGLTAAQKNHVRVLDRVGIPVIETYGKTAACGMLAANTYAEPHLNLIGIPLAHVAFRLGAESVLEYSLTSPHLEDSGGWISSGDVAQMTPFGYAIVGRKMHQITTRGGVVISPARFEWKLTDSDVIQQACIVGDRMPFLGALVVLSPESRVEFEQNPDAVRDQVAEIVAQVNETLPRDGTIKKFEILPTPFLEVTGEILPNGAVNRVKILETRGDAIAQIYGSAPKKQSQDEAPVSEVDKPV